MPVAEARASVLETRDSLGRPVDWKIMDTVSNFLVAGLSTVGSCQGHVGRALPYPWVDFGYGPDFPEDNARLGEHMGSLLESFLGIVGPQASRLELRPLGGDAGSRTHRLMPTEPYREASCLESNRQEIERFSAFARTGTVPAGKQGC